MLAPGAPSVSSAKAFSSARCAAVAERRVIDLLARQPGEPIVAPAVERQHKKLSLQESDKRQKPLAVQAVLVKLVRRAVRGRHDHDAGIEQRREQAFEDHRVGDVVDLELVEAEQRRRAGDVGGDLGDRLARSGAALLLDPVVDLEHEGVEMHPPLVRDRRDAEEQIHQQGFAAPDRAAQIEADRGVRVVVLGQAKAGEPAVQPGFGAIIEQRAMEALQPLDRQLLRRIGFEPPLPAQCAVKRHRLPRGASGVCIKWRHRNRKGWRGVARRKNSERAWRRRPRPRDLLQPGCKRNRVAGAPGDHSPHIRNRPTSPGNPFGKSSTRALR